MNDRFYESDDWMHDDRMASHPDEYWEMRPSPNPPVVADGDQLLALLLDLADSPVASGYGRLLAQLAEFQCLMPTPPDELHLTVKLFDHAPAAGTQDGSSSVSAAQITDAVTEIIDDHESFDIDFPRLDLFPDTVYAEVDDGSELVAFNETLCQRPWTTTSDRDGEQFIPHTRVV